MNIITGILIIIIAMYALNIAIGAFLGSATDEVWEGTRVGSIIATIITVVFGVLVTGVLVMIR